MNDEASQLHHELWAMIPWVVNGTAEAAQCRRLELHAAGCADCREELAFQRLLQQGMRAETGPPHAAEPALQRLLARIDQAEPLPSRVNEGWQGRRWLVAAVLVQAIGLSVLGTLQWQHAGSADYQTLSQTSSQAFSQTGAEAAPARIRLVPSPEMRLAELQALLSRTQMRVVDTDGSAAILGLAPAPGASLSLVQSLALLRAEPGVRLAEPVPAPAP
jgi:hypothetical protein